MLLCKAQYKTFLSELSIAEDASWLGLSKINVLAKCFVFTDLYYHALVTHRSVFTEIYVFFKHNLSDFYVSLININLD